MPGILSFAETKNYPISGVGRYVVTGDLDSDGKDEIIFKLNPPGSVRFLRTFPPWERSVLKHRQILPASRQI